MNRTFKTLGALGLLVLTGSCSSLLDVNTNPNAATSVTPDNMLANALVVTAANYTGGQTASATASYEDFNTYAAFAVDQLAKSGTISGYPEERFYNYTTGYKQNLWALTYDNLNDYQIIQTNGTAQGYPNHAAIARIMKVYNYLLLVDEYGDIPYTQALQGVANTAPAYDKAEAIYKDLIVQLKGAIDDINAAASKGPSVGPEDVVFKGSMLKWKQFANSLRLRILLRESSTSDATRNAYVATEMASLQAATDGYITTDVVVQPTYAASSNQQNPFYNAYGAYVGGTAAPNYSYILPTKFVLRQYQSNADTRLAQLYRPYPSGTTYKGTDAGEAQPPLGPQASRLLLGGYFLRSATQPTILMLLSENLFNLSEAETRGLITVAGHDAKTDFQNGIKASFMTTFRDAVTVPATIASSTAAGVAQSTAYQAAGTGNALIDWEATSTNVVVHVAGATADNGGPTDTTPRTVSKQEKILYQKYLAENIFGAIEAWDDYRRTNLPNIELSLQAATPGKYPRRLFYPTSELNTNAANLPQGVNQYTPIFWQK